MTSYVIVNLKLRDPAAYEEYKAKAPGLIARHGGEYIVRGGHCEVLEGNWQPNRLVLLRFPDRNAVLAFLDDPEYAPLKALRHRVADTDLIVVEGVS